MVGLYCAGSRYPTGIHRATAHQRPRPGRGDSREGGNLGGSLLFAGVPRHHNTLAGNQLDGLYRRAMAGYGAYLGHPGFSLGEQEMVPIF